MDRMSIRFQPGTDKNESYENKNVNQNKGLHALPLVICSTYRPRTALHLSGQAGTRYQITGCVTGSGMPILGSGRIGGRNASRNAVTGMRGGMYQEGSDQYTYHCEKYGHLSKFGFKGVIDSWKAEKWDPDESVALYKKAGAKYFMARAKHHDNFDLYKSSYHKWNSTRIAPKKDLVGGRAAAPEKKVCPSV